MTSPNPFRTCKPGSSSWPTTAPTSAAGRCSPANRPSRANCRPPWAASPANLRCPRAQDAPTPASTLWARWPALPCKPESRPRTCFAPLTAPCPHPYESWRRERCQAPSMRGTRQSPKPTNTGSSVSRSVHPSWPAMSTPALGQWTWNSCKSPPACLRASTTS